MSAAVDYFKSWSPSRLEKWESCPLRAKLELLDKRCPRCFKGTLRGKWGEVQICDTCKQPLPVPEAFARGDDIGNRLDKFLLGGKVIPPEIKNAEVRSLVKAVKAEIKDRTSFIQKWIKLDHKWRPLADDNWSAWFNGRLDAMRTVLKGRVMHVVDWKTGGIDKTTGAPKTEVGTKYEDQVSSYQTTVLSYYPEAERVTGTLVFLDTAEGKDPYVVPCPELTREELPKIQKKWHKRLAPYFADRDFAPRCSSVCRFCAFSKGKGGPCPY